MEGSILSGGGAGPPCRVPPASPLERMDALVGQFQLSFAPLFDEEIPCSVHLSASNCEGKGVKREESGMGGAESNSHQGSARIFNGGSFIATSKQASSELRYDGYDIARLNHISGKTQTNTRKAFPSDNDIQRNWGCGDLAVIC